MRAAPGRAPKAEPASLRLYEDAAWYDASYRLRRRDVRYYVECARRSGGPVLEYGVGTGRVALATARAGVEVVGIDASSAMLARLEQRRREAPASVAGRVRGVLGDMRRVRLGERFALVTAPFNVVLHLDARRDMERWLGRVREHLLPDGELVFDVSVPQPEDLGADPTRWHQARPFRHPVTGRRTQHAERFEYDPLRQVLWVESELWPEGAARAQRVPLVHRQWFPRELEAILHYNGFVDIRLTADFTDAPPDDDVDSLVFSCRVVGPPTEQAKARRSSGRAPAGGPRVAGRRARR